MFSASKVLSRQNVLRGIRNFTQLQGLEDVFILGAARTPVGSFNGALQSLSATKLGGVAIRAAVEQAGIDSAAVDEVYMGNVLQAGVGQAPSRQAALAGGMPLGTPTTTVNKVCASGLKTAMLASQSIMCGSQDVIVAGGMESMSNCVFYLRRGPMPFGSMELIDAIFSDGLTDAGQGILMGACAEQSIAKVKITRAEQDEYAVNSYKKVAAGYASKAFDAELVPVTIPATRRTPEVIVKEDQEPTRVMFDKIPTLRPAFGRNGTITAANASKINDGAGAVVLASGRTVKSMPKVKPLARVIGFCDVNREPVHFSLAPAISIPKLLKQTGVKKDDVAMWEINEAFSSVPLATIKLCGLDPAKVNPHGGAVAIGHPIGASGARILAHLVHSLKPGQKGVASICNGGGGASAMMVERL